MLANAIAQPTVLTYKPGEIVVKQGEPATKFYILLEGEVEIWKETPNQPPKLLNRLTRGEYFGEIGLLEGGKRTATVRVAEGTEAKVMAIEEEFFQLLMENSDLTSSEIARRMHQRVLKSHLTTILPNLELENIDRAIAQVKVIHYGPNSNIIQPGDSPEKFYVLAKGQLEILRRDGEGEEIREKIVTAGEAFGARELIVGENYSYTVRVLPEMEAEVMVLEKEVFSELMVTAYSKLIFTSDSELDRIASVLHRRLMRKMPKS
ncbi:MAG: cyclic nucleotide-binding domain-containing protein [Oscillatoria sp. PMC 1050.18]|nr:cyclic nucleotide-binding domain-containing protein [Oscillatoria sp. PMC 1050.18]